MRRRRYNPREQVSIVRRTRWLVVPSLRVGHYNPLAKAPMTVKEFINQVFQNEYKKIVDKGFHYISFALIGLGIEFLGACLDSNDFDKLHVGRARFTKAIVDLFPQRYDPHAIALYEDIRCGFAHQFRPRSRFVLTHREESIRENTQHLGPYGKQTVLISENLYDDFQKACQKVVTMIDNKTLSHPKLSKPFLKITERI